MPPPAPIPDLPRRALRGRIVTMDAQRTVLASGTVYIQGGTIAAVQPTGAPAPAGFSDVKPVDTRGTIYPGLIELHNHLSYNVLRLWQVPKKYANRGQWGSHADYRKLVSGPMNVLGRTPGYPEAVVRYVECKCLIAGVTTTQGIALFSNAGITRYYRGLVRNVEQTGGKGMPSADARIADVEASDVVKFFERLKKASCILLHLSEGIDKSARAHFHALDLGDGGYAITSSLAGIHCAGLQPDDFSAMGRLGGSMIWSPLSNLLLYGATANVRAAKESGVLLGVGSDWSVSGSKNLFAELKVVRLVNQELGGLFSDAELLAMATCDAARIIKWETAIGSLEPGKLADLLVLQGRTGDPYAQFFQAGDLDISLVVIDGVSRYGTSTLMKGAGAQLEKVRLGGKDRWLNLQQADADPAVGRLRLDQATDQVRLGLNELPRLAADLEKPATRARMLEAMRPNQWFLQLDHEEPMGMSLRMRTPETEIATRGMSRLADAMLRAAIPLSKIVVPLELDEIAIANDSTYFDRLQSQMNLPEYVKTGLTKLGR